MVVLTSSLRHPHYIKKLPPAPEVIPPWGFLVYLVIFRMILVQVVPVFFLRALGMLRSA